VRSRHWPLFAFPAAGSGFPSAPGEARKGKALGFMVMDDAGGTLAAERLGERRLSAEGTASRAPRSSLAANTAQLVSY